METQTKKTTCLVDDHKMFLTSSQPAKIINSNIDTEIDSLSTNEEKGKSIILIDDDPLYLIAMEHFLSQEMPSLRIKTFQTGESFLQHMEQQPDMVILDYYLNSEDASAENGMKILKKIKKINPNIKVVMLSCLDEIKLAMNSIHNGAYDYVSKGKRAFVKIKYLVMNLAGNPAQVKYEKFKRRYAIE